VKGTREEGRALTMNVNRLNGRKIRVSCSQAGGCTRRLVSRRNSGRKPHKNLLIRARLPLLQVCGLQLSLTPIQRHAQQPACYCCNTCCRTSGRRQVIAVASGSQDLLQHNPFRRIKTTPSIETRDGGSTHDCTALHHTSGITRIGYVGGCKQNLGTLQEGLRGGG
jgi:hypothetical protein